jgi:hypothetical protein
MASLPSSYDIERNPGYAFISHGISGYAGSPIRNKGTVHGDCFDDQWLEGVEEGNMRDNQDQNDQNASTDSKGIRSAITK